MGIVLSEYATTELAALKRRMEIEATFESDDEQCQRGSEDAAEDAAGLVLALDECIRALTEVRHRIDRMERIDEFALDELAGQGRWLMEQAQ